ncbi:MAG: prepilin-type N-terminal cleavage/methylation domain-containing protein [Fimbriimonadaceae bacterium]|nr:prepilin-type N-terminal cleavage/methylation domain-containing protein [Fimbriimonadaceae bacterium]
MKRAFTLVEVLVVIAIIVVIAGITFTVSARARFAAKESECMSNLRQIGTGIHLYAGDHDDSMPATPTQTTMRQIEGSSRMVTVEGDPKRWRDSLLRYVGSEQVFYCPLDGFANKAEAYHSDSGVRTNEFTSYQTIELFGWRVQENGTLTARMSEIKPDVVYLSDSVRRRLGGSGYPYETSHGDRISEWYPDGHVKAIPLNE